MRIASSRVAAAAALAALATFAMAGSPGSVAPSLVAQVRLSALPATLASGPAGPINRIAFDVRDFDPADSHASVACIYADGAGYACRSEPEGAEAAGARRIRVAIPDLGRGPRVVVRFSTAAGRLDVPVEIANGPQVVHEIEALLLPDGGATTTRADGAPAPVLQVVTWRATTMPALAAPAPVVSDCERVVAEWVNASATDPVFTSRFGPLNGSLTLARVARGARVAQDTLPEWLISYPLGASRVQFIAHYEVIHRITACADLVRRAGP